MSMQESGEMYLETIYVLLKKMPVVRAIDISEYMGYSKPSVSRALGILKNGGYVTVDSDGSISLLEPGLELAHKIYERHTVLTNLLIKLGVDAKTASDDACRIEHHISDQSFEAIKSYVEKNGI
ncbi:MAG: metal-dependent transcriptional regulator [Ruminococcaceae bacterium]|nr:metal-dependent transcriptional regulator [Oscillospiraceae bacterium]